MKDGKPGDVILLEFQLNACGLPNDVNDNNRPP
jgi:hypothetical protein